MHRFLQKLTEAKNQFWLYFTGMTVLGFLALAGAILGKTLTGYILYSVGTAGLIGLFVFTFFKTNLYKEGRLKLLIIGLIVGLLMASSILLLVSTGSSGGMPANMTSGEMPQMPAGMDTSNFPQGGAAPSGQFTIPTGDAAGTTTFPSGNMPTRSSAGSSNVKTILGWSLLGCALAVLGLTVFWFFKKKIDTKTGRWTILLLGFILGAMIGAAVVLMFATSTASPRTDPTLSMNGQTMPGLAGTGVSTTTAGEVIAATTAAPTDEPSITPTIAATETPEPTATTETISRLVVCLDADIIMGLYVRDIPSGSGNITGTVPAAGCFTINGRSAANPGWYHMAPGQSGYGGIQIYVDDSVTDLWIYAVNIDATESNLNRLQDIVVVPEN